MVLLLWTSGLLIAAFDGLVTRPEFLAGFLAGQLLLSAAGVLAALREDSKFSEAVAASAKAALAPVVALIVASSLNMMRFWGLSSAIYGHSVYYWIAKNFLVTAIISLAFILAGASLDRVAGRLRASA